jgi:hypothetical protein
MSMEQDAQSVFARESEKAEIVAGLGQALDQRYRQICQAASADWERLFGSDPADACVTVRVQTSPSTATRTSGFLKSRRKPALKSEGKESVPHFAH